MKEGRKQSQGRTSGASAALRGYGGGLWICESDPYLSEPVGLRVVGHEEVNQALTHEARVALARVHARRDHDACPTPHTEPQQPCQLLCFAGVYRGPGRQAWSTCPLCRSMVRSSSRVVVGSEAGTATYPHELLSRLYDHDPPFRRRNAVASSWKSVMVSSSHTLPMGVVHSTRRRTHMLPSQSRHKANRHTQVGKEQTGIRGSVRGWWLAVMCGRCICSLTACVG